MYSNDELFEGNNWFAMHDVIVEAGADEKEITKEGCIRLFNALESGTKDEARCWGLGDSVFRDMLSVDLRIKPELLETL